MKQEDLFEAIGNVESSRLLRTELEYAVPSKDTHKEDKAMKTHSKKKTLRILLVAAVLVSMLGITAYASVGYLLFENPKEMLTSIFGNKTGYDHKDVTHWTDPEKPGEVYDSPAFDRVPVDEEVMQSEAVPLVSPVGQSISWKGYTLTVDANMYDQATKCGLLTYTIENPYGLPEYEVANTGEVYFPDGEIVSMNQYGYSYIIQNQSTDKKLTATYYYQLRNPNSEGLELTFSLWTAIEPEKADEVLNSLLAQLKQETPLEEALKHLKEDVEKQGYSYDACVADLSQEQLEDAAYSSVATAKFNEIYQCPDKITIPEAVLGEMSSITLADGKVTVSPIAICVDATDMQDYPNGYISITKIRFKDGTEYVVRDDNTANYVFAVGSTDKDVTFMFNRILDVKDIASVILDGGLEFSVS